MEGDSLKPLLRKAGALLARRAYSSGELRHRLSGLAAAEDLDAVLQRLQALNLLNDEEYAYNFASRRMTQDCWGPARIRSALLRRFVAPELAESAVARAGREIGDEQIIENYLEKYARKAGYPRDRKELSRLFQRLLRRGFSGERIRKALERKMPAAAWQVMDPGD